MSDLLNSIITPEVRMAGMIFVFMVACLYVLSIIWVIRDAYQRGAKWPIWGIVSLIPLVGVIAYCLLRPPLLQLDKDEQELEIAYKQRALSKYGSCGRCGYPVESDYVVCPNCRAQLKNLCPRCGKPLEIHWNICPYCATAIARGNQQSLRRPNAAESQRRAAADTRTRPLEGSVDASGQSVRRRRVE